MRPNPFTITLTALARLLEYPGNELVAPCRSTDKPGLARFQAAMAALTQDEREELYTATFDVSPACVPYVSIHLFGEENFKRGEFMAALQARYQQAGFSAARELPDHLSVLLRFVAQTAAAERRELVEFCLLGPVTKMVAALGEANPYRTLLEAVRETLQAEYPGMQPALSPIEQMQQHGEGCAAVTAGCGCEAVRIQDGPNDDTPSPANPTPSPKHFHQLNL